ncbi:MAG TPA: L,D-transpeptidase family protein [Woeseiaceae bacterium]|nr:L,D-transpeptidase family protein [Woeseiaceae bacterium]
MIRASRLPFLFLPAVLLLSGCAGLEDFLATRLDRGETAAPPLAERPRLDPISRNVFLLESPQQSVIGRPQIVFTNAQDTFSYIAREYGLGYDELVAANPGVDPWLPGEGTPVLLPTQYVLPDVPRRGIVLNIAAKRLFYFPEAAEGEPARVFTYPIGIGRVGWATPTGEAEVIARATDPVWYVPWSVQQEHAAAGDPLPPTVPPGPDNPLGRYVLQLDMPGYLIHGTNKPYGVGMRVSHGCVRLYPENIEQLYAMVGIGVPVTIVNEPYLVGMRDGQVYFEAHAPLADDPVDPAVRLEKAFAAAASRNPDFGGIEQQNRAQAIASAARGVPVRLTAGDAFEVYERALVVKNTVEPDPDAPTLAEVRELLDAPLPDEEQDPTAAPAGGKSDAAAGSLR